MERSSSLVSAVGLSELITSGTATADRNPTTQPSPETSQPPSMMYMDYKPEPTADRKLMPAMDPEPEPMPTKEPEPQSKSEKVCEPATSVTEETLVELDTDECLIDWEMEVMLPTLPCPVPSEPSSLPLVLPSIMPVSSSCIEMELSSLILPNLPLPPQRYYSAGPSAPPSLVPFSPSTSPLTPCRCVVIP